VTALALLDATVMNIALPTAQKDLGFSVVGACCPGTYGAQSPDGLSIAAGHEVGAWLDQDCQSVEFSL
jgi:hypothetical protein